MNATTILCILLLSLYLVLAVFWIVRSIIDTIDDRKREKRNAALEAEREARNAKWEAERQQLERERAMNTLTPYPTKAPVRSGMPTRKKFKTASSKNIRRSGKRKRLHRATLTAAVRCNRPAPRTSRRERSRKIRTEAATPSVPHRRKKKLLPT